MKFRGLQFAIVAFLAASSVLYIEKERAGKKEGAPADADIQFSLLKAMEKGINVGDLFLNSPDEKTKGGFREKKLTTYLIRSAQS